MSAPHRSSGAGVRLARAAVFAAVCVVLAAAGHSVASCASVPLWTLGAGFLGVLAVAAPLAGRVRPLTVTAPLLALGQAVLHTVFGLGQHGAQTGTAAGESLRQALHLACGGAAAAVAPAGAAGILDAAGPHGHHPAVGALDSGSSFAVLPSLPMLLVHVVAAAAAGWMLHHGDLALLRLAELSAHGVAEAALVRALRSALGLVRALHAGLPGAPAAGPRPPLARPAPVPVPRAAELRHAVIRRGPPADSCFRLAA